MPIVDGDEILGELFLAISRRPGGFSAEDEELLRLLAAHAAIALVNARLYERGRELSIVEERHRIARELHDAVTQKLFSLRLTADAAATLLDTDTDRARAELATVRRLAAEATVELRAIDLDYFKPVTTRYNVAVSKGVLSAAGLVEYAPTIKVVELERATGRLLVGTARRQADGAAPLLGSSEAIRRVRERIERVAATDFTILIEGESGPEPHPSLLRFRVELVPRAAPHHRS